MAISEDARHRLYQRLEEVLGEDQATTLMEHLPPVGWADVATKRDLEGLATKRELDELRNELRNEMAELRAEIAELRVDLHKTLTRMSVTMFASMVSFAGVIVGALHLG